MGVTGMGKDWGKKLEALFSISDWNPVGTTQPVEHKFTSSKQCCSGSSDRGIRIADCECAESLTTFGRLRHPVK
jgi:hypothetical protein